MENCIVSYCTIKNNSVWINGGKTMENNPSEELSVFLAALYKSIELNYPKFFKMDKLCKLGVLATELLVRNTPGFALLPKNEMALVFANKASSLESDRSHAQAIADKQNYFPSPSVFVYTLPNIVIGEIAIKHKITGENAFFVSEQFDADLLHSYTEDLLQEKSASSVIAGWINVDGPDAGAFVYCVKNLNFKQENSPGSYQDQKPHTTENIQHLYSI